MFSFLSGCTAVSNATIGKAFAKRHSYILADEKSGIQFLTYNELIDRLQHLKDEDEATVKCSVLAKVNVPSSIKNYLDNSKLGLKGPDAQPQLAPLAAALIPIVSDYIVNQIQTEITNEASRYKHQFTTSSSVDDYYDGRDASHGLARYAGVEIYRQVDGNTEAFELIAALVPSKTSGVLMIRPLYLRTQDSSAKIAFGHSVSTDVVFSQSSTSGATPGKDAPGQSPPATQPAPHPNADGPHAETPSDAAELAAHHLPAVLSQLKHICPHQPRQAAV
jgi:hypothetical protein